MWMGASLVRPNAARRRLGIAGRLSRRTNTMDRSALFGLTTGAAVMFGFGCVWLLIGLLRGRPTPAWLRVSVLVAGIALGASIATLGLRASRTPPSAIAATARQREANRELGRHFYRVVAIEMMAIFLAVIVLNATHRPDYILCAIALIVGVHFLPLAHWFGLALYYGTGAVGCAIG